MTLPEIDVLFDVITDKEKTSISETEWLNHIKTVTVNPLSALREVIKGKKLTEE